jgi:hypothetical protein
MASQHEIAVDTGLRNIAAELRRIREQLTAIAKAMASK